MSRAASLPGAELVLRNRTFFEQATCPGQLRCLGQNFFSEIVFLLTRHLSWAASLPGAELLLKKYLFFFEQATCPGQLRCPGQNFFSKSDFFLEEATCPGQLRCPGQFFFSQIRRFFERATCPGQLRCLGQNCSQNRMFLNKPLVPGSFAARGRFFPQKS